ncbi:MAG TPA: hypothetical protein VKX16_10180 [Chloroflexota bacterium]|nr:hypothetical protein [Chloroflexota bacterium]
MRLVVQAVASVVASILATWLLRRLVLSTDPRPEAGASGGQSGVVVVIVPIMAGNHWHINQPGQKPHRIPGFGSRGLK